MPNLLGGMSCAQSKKPGLHEETSRRGSIRMSPFIVASQSRGHVPGREVGEGGGVSG